jgi:hypothetical protein
MIRCDGVRIAIGFPSKYLEKMPEKFLLAA